jgi:hypothetical protein
VLIEQAIFTSVQTDRGLGYQLVSHSPNLAETDARELAVWGPSHDSLLERPGEASSVNFHQLTSGSYCVSRTSISGAEYSGRGGARVYTQFLVVPPDVLARFANNPFAVLRAATAIGAMPVYDDVPKQLEPVRLNGRAAVVDLPLLARLAREPGPLALATLVQAALSSDRLAIASKVPAEQLLAGFVSVLPTECRGKFSFSTGLKVSPSRPVRIVALGNDPSTWRSLARGGATLLNLDTVDVAETVCWEGWAGHVAEVLSSGKLSVLTGELEPSRPWLTCENLDSLCERLKREDEPAGSAEASECEAETADMVEVAGVTSDAPTFSTRADGPHSRLARIAASADTYVSKYTVEDLAKTLATQPPEVLELLERVDDLVFAAIRGDERALTELDVLWSIAVDELDEDLIEQSREQYLRCALSIWNECVEGDVHRAERAVAAIDVLCVLFEE